LPTRLRRYEDFESSLASVAGTRNIFKLQSSILPEKSAKDERRPTNEKEEDSGEEATQDTTFDIDFTANDHATPKKPHIFSQIRVSRGWEDDSQKAWNPTKDPSLSQRHQSRRTQHLVHK
jgi:hypothetical protein